MRRGWGRRRGGGGDLSDDPVEEVMIDRLCHGVTRVASCLCVASDVVYRSSLDTPDDSFLLETFLKLIGAWWLGSKRRTVTRK
jgi:hypothetical protein